LAILDRVTPSFVPKASEKKALPTCLSTHYRYVGAPFCWGSAEISAFLIVLLLRHQFMMNVFFQTALAFFYFAPFLFRFVAFFKPPSTTPP